MGDDRGTARLGGGEAADMRTALGGQERFRDQDRAYRGEDPRVGSDREHIRAPRPARDMHHDWSPPPALNRKTETTTFDMIVDRILSASRDVSETTHRLDNHADAMHGPQPEEAMMDRALEKDVHRAALDRVFMALDDLDRAVRRNTCAAVRNCTLA